MTTDPFTEAARAVGADPEEVRESMRNATEYVSRNGMNDAEFVLWIWHAGAIYGRDHLAAQEVTDAEVEAARAEVRDVLRDQYKDRYNLGRHDSINIGDEIDIDETAEMVARAALSAAYAARRDEEKR